VRHPPFPKEVFGQLWPGHGSPSQHYLPLPGLNTLGNQLPLPLLLSALNVLLQEDQHRILLQEDFEPDEEGHQKNQDPWETLGKVSGVNVLQSADHRWVRSATGSATTANPKVVVSLNDTVLIVLSYCLQE
jgi:hypothetical protein